MELEKDNNLVLQVTNNPFPFYVEVNKKINKNKIQNQKNNFHNKYNWIMEKATMEVEDPTQASYNPLLSYLLKNDPNYKILYCKQIKNNSQRRKNVKKIIQDKYNEVMQKEDQSLKNYIESFGNNIIDNITLRVLERNPQLSISLLRTIDMSSAG